MKYLKQFLIIIIVSFIGEGLKLALPVPVPASIYGMLIMFICLMTGLIKLEQVKDAGEFLIEIMPVMFIPAGVGLMTSWDILKPLLMPASIITVVTVVTVFLATGRVSQAIIRRDKRKRDNISVATQISVKEDGENKLNNQKGGLE